MQESSESQPTMGRPPVETHVQLPADLRERLDEYAGRHYRSRSSVIVAAIAKYLRLEAERGE